MNNEFEPWGPDHDLRQEFRRMLDPGILRNNDKNDAARSLRVWGGGLFDDSSL